MINKLVSKIQKTNAPIVVGLDPMLNYIPKHIQDKAFAEFGETPAGAAEAIWQYNKAIVDATYDLIPAVKPQIAMYEQFGVEGVKAFQKTVDYCHEKDLVVIGDVKRGDIGSTVFWNAFTPSTPNCSYIAICGFTAGIRSYVLSTISLLNCQIASAAPSKVSPCSANAALVMCSGMNFIIGSRPTTIGASVF